MKMIKFFLFSRREDAVTSLLIDINIIPLIHKCEVFQVKFDPLRKTSTLQEKSTLDSVVYQLLETSWLNWLGFSLYQRFSRRFYTENCKNGQENFQAWASRESTCSTARQTAYAHSTYYTKNQFSFRTWKSLLMVNNQTILGSFCVSNGATN